MDKIFIQNKHSVGPCECEVSGKTHQESVWKRQTNKNLEPRIGANNSREEYIQWEENRQISQNEEEWRKKISSTVLHREHLRLRRIGRNSKTILIAVASGSCYGWVTPMLVRLLGPDSEVPMTISQSSWMVSVIEIGNLISPLPAGYLINHVGRKPLILITGPLYLVSWLVVVFIKKVEALYVARILQGLSMGFVLTIMPLYLGEISSPKVRGIITNTFQNAFRFGYLLEYCLGPYFSYTNLAIINAIVPALFTLVFLCQPESPYYLLVKGKEQKAVESLARLRGKSIEDVKSQLDDMNFSVQKQMVNKCSIKELIACATQRRALLIVLVVGSVKILSGLVAILAYSTELFTQTKITILSPDHITIALGLVMFVSSMFSSVVIDLSGRRPIVLISTLGCACSLFPLSVYLYLSEKTSIDVSAYGFVPPLTIILYCTFVAFGLDPVSVIYRSELFPANTRGVAASISAIISTLSSFFTVKFYQVFSNAFGVYVNYMLFSVWCFIGTIWLYFIAVETKGKTLSEVQDHLRELSHRNKKTLCDDVTSPPN